MTRDELKKEYHDYQAAARRMCADLPNVSVPDHASAHVPADRDGAFVDAVIWVPKKAITQCCMRDHNGDGNCYIHSAPGVLRHEKG